MYTYPKAYAKFGIGNTALADALASRAMEKTVKSRLNAQNIANLAWAFAKLNILNVKLMVHWVGRVVLRWYRS